VVETSFAPFAFFVAKKSVVKKSEAGTEYAFKQ
jgi:hypothetical protein